MSNIIILTEENVKKIIKAALYEVEQEKMTENEENTLLTINQVAKKLKMAHTTVKKLVEQGLIKATKNNRISIQSLNEYLQGI